MTAPTRRPLPALDALRAAHDDADELFRFHWRVCRAACGYGGICERGQQLRDDADLAGRRWEYAQTGKWGTW